MAAANSFEAFVSWPSAPLTDSLVRKALNSLPCSPTISSLSQGKIPESGNILQWSTYDLINHDLSYSHSAASKVLSSTYVIRKALIRKHYLSRCLHNYLIKHPDTILRNAVPRTWDLELSFADELDEMWGDDLWDLGRELDEGAPDKWWILKPGMADRGMGIRIFHSKEDLTRIFEEFDGETSDDEVADENETPIHEHDTSVVTSQLRHFVIQEYLSNTLLLDPAEVPVQQDRVNTTASTPDQLTGHKFHLRAYCVASGALTVYLYTRILALFSSVPYSPPLTSTGTSQGAGAFMDMAAHLTNTSLQTECGEAGVRLFDELPGCHILSSPATGAGARQSTYLRSREQQTQHKRPMGQSLDEDQIRESRSAQSAQGVERKMNDFEELFTPEDVEDIKQQMADILAETFKAALDMSVHFQPLPNAFELYGVDFLVIHTSNPTQNRRYQVHILEVNSEPAIELTGPRLTWILEDLFCSIAKVCVQPFFQSKYEAEGKEGKEWAVGETQHYLRKCLQTQVRGAGGW